MSLEVKVGVKAAGDVGVLTREEKEARGLVPRPLLIEGFKPIRWAEFRLIAEAGRCHNDPIWGQRAATAASLAGFWGFKVQLLTKGEIATSTAPRYGDTPGVQWDDFKGGMDRYGWADVRDAATDAGLLFFASAWDEESVDLALNLGCPLLKVGSGDITNELLLRYIGGTGLPIILSTGASTVAEVDRALEWLGEAPQIVLAACTLAYPSSIADAHLNRVTALKATYPHALVGYSDHCAEPWIVGAAKKAGALFVEAHWTITPGGHGDDAFALHPGNIGEAFSPAPVNGDIWGPIDLEPCPAELPARTNARRSLATRLPLVAGDHWRLGDLTALRPGTGLPPYEWRSVLGRRVRRDYQVGELVDQDEAR